MQQADHAFGLLLIYPSFLVSWWRLSEGLLDIGLGESYSVSYQLKDALSAFCPGFRPGNQ